jgi:hypothetical protein
MTNQEAITITVAEAFDQQAWLHGSLTFEQRRIDIIERVMMMANLYTVEIQRGPSRDWGKDTISLRGSDALSFTPDFSYRAQSEHHALIKENERLRAALGEIASTRYTMSQALNEAHVYELTAKKMRAIADAALSEDTTP